MNKKVTVDFSKRLRKMKPMHGVNNGPWTGYFKYDAGQLYKEAGIPFVRLHDTEYPYGHGEFVDIDCVFKYFDADVNEKNAYNFTFSDMYIKAIIDAGGNPLYRLGQTIEHCPVKLHIYPPKDYLKWAQICEHIIMHYNEGWNNGHHWNIKYWEIWTEPNHGIEAMHPGSSEPLLWYGTAEEFAKFYTVVSTYLKERFPDLMIGGPAFSNPDDPFVRSFFKALTKGGAHPPIDFYSWHGYVHDMKQPVERAKQADAVLKEFGYAKTESVYDEWNYCLKWSDMETNYSVIQTMKGAAMSAAMFAVMQPTNTTAMAYYDAQMGFKDSFDGLFGIDESVPERNGKGKPVIPKKAYFSFKAFNELYRLGAKNAPATMSREQDPRIADQVKSVSKDEQIYALASTSVDGTKGAILLSSYADLGEELLPKDIDVKLSGMDLEGKKATVYLLDESHDLTPIYKTEANDFTICMNPYTVALIVIE